MDKSEHNKVLSIAVIDDHEIIGHGIQNIFLERDKSAVISYFPSLSHMNTPRYFVDRPSRQ